MTAPHLLHRQQEAPMSRVEPKEHPAKREAQEGRRRPDDDLDRKPIQAESDESTVDEVLPNQDHRR
jgi:hypothetical protein